MKRCVGIVVLLAAAGTVSAVETNAPARPPPPPVAAMFDPMLLPLPDMNFRQATVPEIVEWIREKSIAADPGGNGINLLLKDNAKGVLASTRLTLTLTKPTVRRALDLLASSANLYIRRDSRVTVIEPSQQVIGR